MRHRFQTADCTSYELLRKFAEHNRRQPTEAESVLWHFLRGGRMGAHFRQQHVILDYIPDFACLSEKLIIEVDGGYHLKDEQPQRDEERTAELNALGFRVLRFTNEEVLFDTDRVLEIIEKEINKIEK